MVSEGFDQTQEVSRLQRFKMKLVSLVSYLLPLLVSIPPWYAGLMTIPLLVFLIVMGGRLSELPTSLPHLFLGGTILETFVMVIGFVLLTVSVVVLWRGRSEGLVTHSVYRLVRHPQYLGLILLTAGLTSRSVWILSHTDGIGWLGIQETILLWIAMVVAYNFLALIEELHLSKVFSDFYFWSEYMENTGFIIPFPVKVPRIIEVILGIVIPIAILYGLTPHWS